MTTQPWKLLIYLCGDAAERLPADPHAPFPLLSVLQAPAGLFQAPGALVVVQAHRPAARQALRLVQEAGEAEARIVDVVMPAAESPAGRDEFMAWAMESYSTARTLLLMGECQPGAVETHGLAGSLFEVIDSPDGPELRVLAEADLAEFQPGGATRGPIGDWLNQLLGWAFGGGGPQPPSQPAKPTKPKTSKPAKPKPPKETTPMPPQQPDTSQPERDWTILLYMAGDNGRVFKTAYGNYSLMAEMTTPAWTDLAELEHAIEKREARAEAARAVAAATGSGAQDGAMEQAVRDAVAQALAGSPELTGKQKQVEEAVVKALRAVADQAEAEVQAARVARDEKVAALARPEPVGSTDRVAVLAQLDTLGTEGTMRFEIQRGRTAKENIVEQIAETNTGDPSELARFVVWGMNRRPAKHTMLVLWNHGLGWKDDDIYASVRSVSRSVRAGRPLRRHNVAAFRSTAREILHRAQAPGMSEEVRGILCDDSSMDFLTNKELKQALRVAEVAADEAEVGAIFGDEARLKAVMDDAQAGTRRKLSIIGMDACLMAMLEVQYQVRQYAQYMVASQEVEPMDGWPYSPIVGKLNENPAMTPKELAAWIVDAYAESYTSGSRSKDVTQSAIDLSQMEETANKVRAFAEVFVEEYSASKLAKAHKYAASQATEFEDQEYADLAAYLSNFLEMVPGGPGSRVARAGQELLQWVQQETGPVVRNAATGKYREVACGVSIYVAEKQPSPLYQELDFAATGWPAVLGKTAS